MKKIVFTIIALVTINLGSSQVPKNYESGNKNSTVLTGGNQSIHMNPALKQMSSIQADSQIIILPASWSIFSTYIQPSQQGIADVVSPVLPNLLIVKNWDGQPYWPQYGVNLIGDIVPGQGYQVKMATADTLVIEGIIIGPDTLPIIIQVNWSIIGYLRTTPAPVEEMLSGIAGSVIIVKDGNGQSYWPQYGVNLIGYMQPGQGYQIKMTAEDTLTYPANDTTATSFTCGFPISDYDGNIYNTVLIDSMCWMQENLRTTHYADGTTLLDGTNAGDISGDYISKYYFDFNNDTANTTIYGKLYTWAAMMNGASGSSSVPSGIQGVCPNGWHVPSDDEWTDLTDYFGGLTIAGGKLKEAGTEHWSSPNTGASNESGFTALPGGYRYSVGSFGGLGHFAEFWTSTESINNTSWFRTLYFQSNSVIRGNDTKAFGFSVRCIKD